MKYTLTLVLALMAVGLLAQPDHATRRRNLNNENFVGLREFDPVSYFKGKPVRGTEKIQFDYKGITYYFSSPENRDLFEKSPEKYEPQYGGWCAYTMATSGQRIRIDPTAYKIMNGKLYLFHNFNGDNRLMKWNSSPDKKRLVASGDKLWKLR